LKDEKMRILTVYQKLVLRLLWAILNILTLKPYDESYDSLKKQVAKEIERG